MAASHHAYEKMAESIAEWLADEVTLRHLARLEWSVSEKIHGANFSLVIDPERVGAAKRKAMLGDAEDFFGHGAVVRTLAAPARVLFDEIAREVPGLRAVQVVGELFGGRYPHPAVPPTPGAHPVQTGVWYCPEVRFLAFDLALSTDEGRRYLDLDDAMARAGAAGVPWLPPLFRGSYQEAMDYPLGFDSTLPALLGLPPLGAPNRAEGVVVRPVRSLEIETRRGRARPLLKRKIAEFAEDAREHQAAPPPAVASPGYALDLLEWELQGLLNPNRLAAARSKAGPEARPGELEALLLEDLEEELRGRHPALLDGLAPQDRELLEALARDAVEGLVRG